MNQVKSPRDVVIVGAARTAIGRGKRPAGIYSEVHPSTLLAHTYGAVLERAGVDAGQVGEVIAGAVTQVGEQSNNLGRLAWLQAGYPVEVPATTIDMQCGSSQQAVHLAGRADQGRPRGHRARRGRRAHGTRADGQQRPRRSELGAVHPELLDRYALTPQGLSAELIAERWGLSRQELDEFGVRSQALALAAARRGRVRPRDRAGDRRRRAGDPRPGHPPGTTLEGLAALRPAFKPDGVVTAATSSQLSDGAAAVLLASREAAERLGLPIRAEIVDQLVVGVDR